MGNTNLALSQWLLSPWLILPLLIWSLFWKGLALWQSANRKHLVWFIILLGLNTLGILEILYVGYLHRWDLGSQKLLNLLKRQNTPA